MTIRKPYESTLALGEAFYNRATAFAALGKDDEAKIDLEQSLLLGVPVPK